MPFQKGQSGNPGGRPKAEVQVRDLARQHTEAAIKALVAALAAKQESTRVSAAQALLDRGWGKAAQIIAGDQDNPVQAKLVVEIIDPTKDT